MGLDIGDSRMGVALSDPLGILASPLTIISRTGSGADIREVIEIALKNKVERIIVGLPISMDGSMGKQAEKVKGFAAELGRHTDIPVEFKDERLSTVVAKRMIQGVRKTNRDTRYDAAAAALILQRYLDDTATEKGLHWPPV
ncbi:MAG: Holliday junction resolvase RuvX [Chloroflexota bacterium]